MSNSIHAVTVYCSSSADIGPAFFRAADELGAALAAKGWKLVYGGNALGLMGCLADAVRHGGGGVVGVTPRLLVDKGYADERCEELIITDDMRRRKAIMEERGDAFIALPGGLGTLEEIFEIIVARLLGFHDKPIVMLNIDGYYDPLIAMIEHGIALNFIKARSRHLYAVMTSVAESIDFLSAHASARAVIPPAVPKSVTPE